MPWPVHPNGLLGAQGDNDTYRIERSLRFNSADSTYLNRTPASAGNRKTWTWSGWVKRSSLGGAQYFLGNAQAPTGTNGVYLGFGTDSILFGDYGASAWDWYVETLSVYRDISAWYHIVVQYDTTQSTSSDRVKLYVNGTRLTAFNTATYPTLNTDGRFNQASVEMAIGRLGTYNGNYFNGYLTEINFIDGQALTPSSFGETDAITGRWKAKAYSGTYGTNGFYLKFADNSGTTATTLGKDSSGNSNNWTPNNFSVTAGAGNDSFVDSPTNYGSDSGIGGEVRGNYATMNPLIIQGSYGFSISDGNLRPSVGTTAGAASVVSTIGATSGKWYAEFTYLSATTPSGTTGDIGVITNPSAFSNFNSGNTNLGAYSRGYSYAMSAGTPYKYNNGTITSYGSTWSVNDIIGVALNIDAGSIEFFKNGVSQGVAFTGLPSGYEWFFGVAGSAWVFAANFGQRPFAYTAPTGFKALCTTNLPTPTIKKPSSYMDAVTFTATGADQTITGFNFSPDLVWIKNRANWAGNRHTLFDTTRGVTQRLDSSTTEAEASDNDLTAFNSNGFSGNLSGTTYVAWAWDEAPIAGMDIVGYTGTGAIRTVAHNLGVAPKMIIAKLTNSAGFQWPVYHSSLTSASSYIWLNSTNAQATDAAYWGTAPTSSVFSVGTNANVNNNTSPYIAYLFAEVEGFSKFGSYTGNGSADGPFVWCGFRPRWVMVKSSSSAQGWQIIDSSRSQSNAATQVLQANSANAENTVTSIDIISNGFKIRTDGASLGINTSSATYIFAAFAESPFKYARAR